MQNCDYIRFKRVLQLVYLSFSLLVDVWYISFSHSDHDLHVDDAVVLIWVLSPRSRSIYRCIHMCYIHTYTSKNLI